MAYFWPSFWRIDKYLYVLIGGLDSDTRYGSGFKARSRTADEVPTGFYNFFEMIVEMAYNFAEGITGPKVKTFFPGL
ncbi:MAG: hypothetical protein M5U34_15920 [Chloroflexi bacterium]|nr:hypothetical protein [Chloroflexota bacterium]